MGEPGIKFDLSSDPPIDGMVWALDKLADGVSDFTTLLEGFDTIFRSFMTKQFESQGSFGAGGWQALSPAYDAWKQEHYPGRPIGVLTGALRSAMTGSDGYSAEITRDSASYGMSAGSAATAYGKHFAARRPVIAWSGAQSREFQKFSQVWLNTELDKVKGHGSAFGGSEVPNVPGVFGGL